MAEVPTHFPPQTYSSSFFLNAIPEEDKVCSKIKLRDKSENSQSSPLLDCFFRTMYQMRKMFLILLIIQYLSLWCEAKQCSVVKDTAVREFDSLVNYQGNKITFDAVKGKDFQGNYVKIKHIHEHLEKNDFLSYDSEFIMRLMLNNLHIRSIEDGSFLQLDCLESLELQDNLIESVSSMAFENLTHLRFLNLSNNLIEKIPINLFNGLGHLKSLDLSHNRLKDFGQLLTSLSSLTHLNISYNYLLYLDVENWHDLKSLNTLDVSHNTITDFLFSVNITFTNMTRLLLNDNRLKDLSIFTIRKHAPNLVLLTLEGNPWPCDDLGYILKSLNDTRIMHTGQNKTEINLSGIDCIDYTRTTTPRIITTTKVPSSRTLSPGVMRVYNNEVLEAISDLKSIMTCLFVFLTLFMIFEVTVRSGLARRVVRIFRTHDELLYDHSSVENIRLITPSTNRL